VERAESRWHWTMMHTLPYRGVSSELSPTGGSIVKAEADSAASLAASPADARNGARNQRFGAQLGR
jgi:hypothetical protein